MISKPETWNAKQASKPKTPNPKLNVLLIEDNPGDVRLIQEMLTGVRDVEVELESANQLESGLDRLALGGIDGLLLDLSLPDSQGLETFRRAQALEPDVAIIVLTGLDDEELAVKAVRQGAQDYLVKGEVDSNLLVRSIRYAIERKRVQKQTEKQMHRLAILREINLAATATLDLRATLDILVERIDLLLPYSAITVRLLNRQSGEFEPVACRNIYIGDWRAESDHGFIREITECKAPIISTNVQTDQRARETEFFRKHGLVSFVGVPLIAKDELVGILSFYSREEHQFTEDEVEFLTTLAGQAAMAIHNAQLYERLKEQAVELETANKVKTEFLSIMSHELRTPLGIIMMYAGMVQDRMIGEINEKQERALKQVMNQSDELLTMIKNILEATKVEAKKIKADLDWMSPVSFLNDLRTVYGFSLEKNLTLDWDYPSNLPLIQSDCEKLKQILHNLINNALKFTEKGSVTVSARYFAEEQKIEFEVADTGAGIPHEMVPSIFEMFRQLDGSETRTYGGMGLGLYIVKKFTDVLGGDIQVQSEPGKGSTFSVKLPVGEVLSHRD